MKISDINPHIRYASIHYSHPKVAEECHICYDCRIFYIEDASGTVTIGGKTHNITNKTALYFPPMTKYYFNFDKESIKIVVLDFDVVNDFSHIKKSLSFATEKTFTPEKVPKYDLIPELSKPIICTLPQILHSLRQCTESFIKKPPLYRERSSALLKLCLLDFIQETAEKSAHSDICEQVLLYIHQNYADQSITNSDISQKFGYHPYHLSRILKQETGRTLHQHLLHYRIRIAKNLLLTTNYDIDEISWRSGFSSSAYFIRYFHNQTGITPNKYRKNQIQI